jgi:sugar (pentulose or hexulose) kinase
MNKKIIAPLVVGGTILAGLGTSTVASAATPANASTSHPKSHVMAWVRAHRAQIRKEGLAISAKTIGVTPQQLASDLKAGNSIAGVASEHNVSAQTVVNALVTAADGRINQAVTAGKLNSTVAHRIEAKLPARVTTIVNHTF